MYGGQETQASAEPLLLDVENVSVRFGGVRALTGVRLKLAAGEICGLIGPNGAGKTTLFNSVTRLNNIAEGAINLAGRRIDNLPPQNIISAGIARTFQNLGLYPGMTVLDNVLLGARHLFGNALLTTLFRPFHTRAQEREARDWCRSILHELDLESVAQERADALSYGTLKRVEIARAIAARPRLLLLDEPAGGLTHSEVATFGEMVTRLRDSYGLTVLLVEHHMGLVMSLCSRLVVLHLGRNLAEGKPADIRANQDVINAYLGRAAAPC